MQFSTSQSLLICFCLCLYIVATPACKNNKGANVIGTKDTLLCYIMAGQSNMAGRGAIDPSDIVVDQRLLMEDSNNQFVLAKEPFDFYEPSIAGLSCGHQFGEKMLSTLDPAVKIGMVPIAIGSTSVGEWLGDSVHVIRLYTTLMIRAREALAHGRLKGMLWQQGETDADWDSTRIGYAGRLQAFILKFRNDVGDPHLPIFIGKLSVWCKKPYKDYINADIEQVSHNLSDIYLIQTDDLSHKPDSLHYDAAGLRALGERMAAAARPLL